jgi:long-chain fatty acid transport protein
VSARGADGAFPISSSPKAAGRGGTDLAVADDTFTVTANPAGMTNLGGSRIDLSLGFYAGQDSYTNAYNHDETVEHFPIPAPAFGFVQSVGDTGSDTDPDAPPPFAFGIEFEPVSGGGGSAVFRTPLFTGGERETSNLMVLGLSFGVAVQVHPRLSLGLSLTALYASLSQQGLVGGVGPAPTNGLVRNFQSGQLDGSDPYFLVNGTPASWGSVLSAASAPNTFSSAIVNVQNATGFGGSGTIGALWKVMDELSIGAAYKTPGFLSPLVGKATLNAQAATSAGSSALNTIQTNFLANHLPDGGTNLVSNFGARLSGLSMPQTLGLGAAFWPIPRVLLALDLKWIDWRTALNTVNVSLTHGTNRDLSEIISNQATSNISSTVLLRWHDQVVVAAGVAVSPLDWLRLRAGYNYAKDPIPTRTEGPLTPATVEHHMTLGAGLVFGHVSFDLAWVHAFAKSTTINGSGVNPAFDGTRHKADQDAILLGGSYEF